jgi:hypothetical protein
VVDVEVVFLNVDCVQAWSRSIFGRRGLRGSSLIGGADLLSSELETSASSALGVRGAIFGVQAVTDTVDRGSVLPRLVRCVAGVFDSGISVCSILCSVSEKQKPPLCMDGDKSELDHWDVGPSIGMLKLLIPQLLQSGTPVPTVARSQGRNGYISGWYCG